MGRLFVLVPLIVWLARPGGAGAVSTGEAVAAATLHVAGLLVAPTLVCLMALRTRRRPRAMDAFVWARRAAPLGVAAWLGVSTHLLGWDQAVATVGGGMPRDSMAVLPLAVGPAYLAWALCILAEWPTARRRYERRVATAIDLGRTPPPEPSAWRWWAAQVRGKLLFALVPLSAFALAKDAATAALAHAGVDPGTPAAELGLMAIGIAAFAAVGPFLTVRTLPTRRAVDVLHPEAAARLSAFAGRCGLRPTEVRIWDTGGSMANALAIGFLPRLRYVLVSDVLLGGLEGRHVEAVLAHEAGHVRHRHMLWLILFGLGTAALLVGPVSTVILAVAGDAALPSWADWTLSILLLGGILAGFAWLSRLFERQADAFAAAVVQAEAGEERRVGEVGAWVFRDALRSTMLLNGVDPERRALPPPGLASLALRLLDAGGAMLHPRYADRVAGLDRLAAVGGGRSLDRRVLGVKLAILVVGAGSLAFV